MILKLILTIYALALFPCIQSKAQNMRLINENTVCWQEGRKLKLNDFRAKNNPNNVGLIRDSISTAYCQPRLSVVPILDKYGKDNFLVCACLDRNRAWISDSSSFNAYLILEHEQLHFDICELVARKIRAEITKFYKAGEEVYGPELGKKIDKFFLEVNQLQDSYDRETDHGKIVSQQERWNVFVKAELIKLQYYKSINNACMP